MSNPFAYAELHTDAPAAAKAFYSQLLSWRMEDAPKSEGRYTEIEPGEGFPAGLTQNKYGGGSHWLPYIRVDDIAASLEKAKRLGATARGEIVQIPEGKFSVLVDPTGAPFGLFERGRTP
jgi:predicted enzyme related to lactoylglutathione lyase